MKRILSVVTVLVMLFAFAAMASADDLMTPVPLTQDNQGSFIADTAVFGETGFTLADASQISFKLPQEYLLGETVLVHIKGSADGNFRVFLEKNGWDRASNIINMSEAVTGYESGAFDVYITFVVSDEEAKGVDLANEINFKGPTYDTNLVNLSLEVCEVFHGDTEAYKAAGGTACGVVGHTIAEYVSNGDATCAEDGTKTGVCSVCGYEETVTDEGSALGHSFAEYVSNDDATCEDDGTETATCSVCGETDTRTVEGSALGHNYVDGVCANCGEAEPVEEEEPAPADDNAEPPANADSSSSSSSSGSATTIIIVITAVVVVAIIAVAVVVLKKKKN